jgi:hypothetical protein
VMAAADIGYRFHVVTASRRAVNSGERVSVRENEFGK